MLKKHPLLSVILAIVVMFFTIYFFIFGLATILDDDIGDSKELNNSFFYVKDDKVYAMVPSGGKFELIGVKASKFRYIDTGKYDNRNVGASDAAVYCGNLVMSGLDPNGVRALGNGYFGDGKITYFCDSVSETNLEISAFKEFWDIVSHKMFNTPKAQSYIYKFRQVDNTNLAAILGFGYASDGVRVYHEGKELEGANASKMRYIEQASGRKSIHFTTDGENVYYDSTKLGIKFNPQMRDIGEIWRIHYLYEPNSGMVYANDHEFDPKFAPYEPLFNLEDEHSYHALFRGKGGIYHWERKWQWYNSIDEGEFVRDGDDPFKGEITPLYGNVVINDGKTYFLKTYEIWHNTKNDHSLSSRHTCIVRLDTKEQWRKIGPTRNDGYGAVYANGDKTYYFDNVGYGWRFNSSVYDINDLGVVEILTRPYGPNVKNLKLDEIVKMVDQGAMTPADGEVVIDAISDFDDYSQKYAYWIFLAIAFVASVVGAIFKNKKQAKKLKKRVDDYRL